MLLNRPLVLASSSPRRQYLMKEAGFAFTVEKPEADESFPFAMPALQVASYIASKKAEIFRLALTEEIVITADTVVILDKVILNKPANRNEAIGMLSSLSGKTHTVVTGVCILSKEKEESFDDITEVKFRTLTPEQIELYVDTYKPYDKAGAYGAQDCLSPGINPCSPEEIAFLKKINKSELIQNSFTRTESGVGMIAIEKITGSYFNVMGLPIHKVYEHLKTWL